MAFSVFRVGGRLAGSRFAKGYLGFWLLLAGADLLGSLAGFALRKPGGEGWVLVNPKPSKLSRDPRTTNYLQGCFAPWSLFEVPSIKRWLGQPRYQHFETAHTGLSVSEHMGFGLVAGC